MYMYGYMIVWIMNVYVRVFVYFECVQKSNLAQSRGGFSDLLLVDPKEVISTTLLGHLLVKVIVECLPFVDLGLRVTGIFDAVTTE